MYIKPVMNFYRCINIMFLHFNLFLHKSWVWAKISQLHLLWNVTSNYTNGALMAKLHSAENVYHYKFMIITSLYN